MQKTTPFYPFHFGRLHLARSRRTESTTGFKRIGKTRFFWSTAKSDRQRLEYLNGFEACRAEVISEIQLTKNAGVRVKPKSWDSGFEAALTFIENKTSKIQPPTL